LKKKPWSQLAPKFSGLVASTSILVAKNVRPLRQYIFTKKTLKRRQSRVSFMYNQFAAFFFSVITGKMAE